MDAAVELKVASSLPGRRRGKQTNSEKKQSQKSLFSKRVHEILGTLESAVPARGSQRCNNLEHAGWDTAPVNWNSIPLSLDSANIILKSRSTGLNDDGEQMPARVLRKRWQVRRRPVVVVGHSSWKASVMPSLQSHDSLFGNISINMP